MVSNNSKVSSLRVALAEPHLLRVFQPDELGTVRDVPSLHARISEYFSLTGAALKESLEAFENAQALTQRCARDEWAEAKVDKYQSQSKHSASWFKDAKNILKDSFTNPLPTVSDAEVSAFIAALTPTQFSTLIRMNAVEQLDGFDYMWDLDEIYNESVYNEKSTIDNYSSIDIPSTSPFPPDESVLGQSDESALPRAVTMPMEPLYPTFITSDNTATGNTLNVTTSDTITEPASAVELAYTICDNTENFGSDRESTESFCQFSRMAIARAEKQGMLRSDSKPVDPSKAETTIPMTKGDHIYTSFSIEESQRDIIDPLHCNKSLYFSLFQKNSIKDAVDTTAKSDRRSSMRNGLNIENFSLTPAKSTHGSSSLRGIHAQKADNIAVNNNKIDLELFRYAQNVLLLSKIRERDEASLRRTIYKEAQREISTALAQYVPAMEKLLALLKEANVLLPAVDSLERAVLSDHVENPSNFLLVPRYALRCSNSTCGTAFSATVMRVQCGRCGQFFCPHCCRERGLGPDVRCGDQCFSLGWEPVCISCWRVCKARQIKLYREDRRQRLITSSTHDGNYRVPSTLISSTYQGDGNLRVFSHNEISSAQPSTEAVMDGLSELSIGTCSSHQRLEDGFVAFQVISGEEDHVPLSDIWSYRMAKMRGSLQCLWQGTGILARRVVLNLTRQLRKQHESRTKRITLPIPQKRKKATSIPHTSDGT